METALVTLFAFGLAFAVGKWLRSHLFLACMVGLGVAAPFAAAVKAGELLAPLVVAVVGAVCGAFRDELSPVWAWCRRSAANAAASGFDRATRGRFRTAGADGPSPEPEREPERRQESFFGGGPTAEERKRREAERERAYERPRESDDERWKRENEERDKKEREEAAAAERAKREEQARQEREREAAARARREREERARQERDKASGSKSSGGETGEDEAKSRYRPPPGAGDIEAALAVLGVSASAGPQAVKKAYRRMAKRWHPDMNQGSKEAEEAFKKVQAAYEALHAAGMAA